jgi:hypothetical protein
MSFAATAMSVDRFASWTHEALQSYGFRAGNALVLVGVCRHELMFAIVILVLPHIGIDAAGHVSLVHRGGQSEHKAANGRVEVGLDRHDIEPSWLRMEQLRRARYGAGQTAFEEVTGLTAGLVDAQTDLAFFSGTVVHGPHDDRVGARRVLSDGRR